MRRKLLTVAMAAFVILTVPFVYAVPLGEKNNDKFQTFSTTGTFSIMDMVFGSHEYIPSIDNVNKFVTSWKENMITYTITVGSNIYTLGTDFDHTGYCVETLYDPVFSDPAKTMPAGSRTYKVVVDYTFDFSAYPGGIEGTLNMRSVFSQGNGFVNSLSGTGDLQNVQAKEIGLGEIFDPVNLVITVAHAGLVHGWPE